jgi:hypothetical protein
MTTMIQVEKEELEVLLNAIHQERFGHELVLWNGPTISTAINRLTEQVNGQWGIAQGSYKADLEQTRTPKKVEPQYVCAEHGWESNFVPCHKVHQGSAVIFYPDPDEAIKRLRARLGGEYPSA